MYAYAYEAKTLISLFVCNITCMNDLQLKWHHLHKYTSYVVTYGKQYKVRVEWKI